MPPRVEYTLSPLGKMLLKNATELANWASSNRQERARVDLDRREASEAERMALARDGVPDAKGPHGQTVAVGSRQALAWGRKLRSGVPDFT
jgi:hypothetical protein